MNDRLTQILNARWLISTEVIYDYIPLAISFLSGRNIDFSILEKERPKPYAISGTGPINTINKYELDEAPVNSVAIICIQDEIFSWRSMELVENLRLVEENPNIIAVLFMVNSPGGMVFYTDIAAAAIKSFSKPKVSFVMNMAASAAMWLISPTDRIIASSPLDRLGSIGTMASLMDFAKFLKTKLNIDIYEIYADKSVNKNKEVRTLLDETKTMDERTAPIRQDLNYVNEIFHKAIQDNLGIDPESDVFTGSLYNAPAAIEMGLAHEINNIDYAITLAHQLGLEYSLKSLIKQF